MDELRDIKPLVALSDPWPWWVWALAALGLLAIAWVAVRRLVRRREVPVAPSPNEAARLALEAVRGQVPSDQARAERLQTHIAVVLRRWLEARSPVHATEMTTEELSGEPSLRTALGEAGRASFVELLAFADGVRFAGRAVPPAEHAACVERAYALVTGAPQ